MLIQVPAGLPAITIGGQEYVADRFGVISVPEGIGEALIKSGRGFAPATERPPPPVVGSGTGV